METSPLPSMETPGETGTRSIEVDYTEIGGFEASGLLTSEQVAVYVRETIPTSHLEQCPNIQYEPDNPEYVSYPYGLAFFDPETHEIKVGPAERFGLIAPEQEMIDTVTHEIGHNAHQNLIEQRPEIAAKRIDLYDRSRSGEYDFVSRYASTNEYEDFAESYMTYVRDPELLQFISLEKYAFMRDFIFAGREYPLHEIRGE